MTHTLMLVPVSEKVGLTMISCGVVNAIQSQKIKVDYFKPIAVDESDVDENLDIIKSFFNFTPPKPLLLKEVLELLGEGRYAEILEKVASNFSKTGLLDAQDKTSHITVIQALNYTSNHASYMAFLNQIVAQAFDAKIIFVTSQISKPDQLLAKDIDALAHIYRDKVGVDVLGYVVCGTDEGRLHELDKCREKELGILIHLLKFHAILIICKKMSRNIFQRIGFLN